MKRYLRIMGKPGILVADPFALHAEPRRYAGQSLKPEAMKDVDHALRFEPIGQTIEDHPSLRRAAKYGEIEILDTGVGLSSDKVTWKEKSNGPDRN